MPLNESIAAVDLCQGPGGMRIQNQVKDGCGHVIRVPRTLHRKFSAVMFQVFFALVVRHAIILGCANDRGQDGVDPYWPQFNGQRATEGLDGSIRSSNSGESLNGFVTGNTGKQCNGAPRPDLGRPVPGSIILSPELGLKYSLLHIFIWQN
jgi:hypothetical protein